VQQGGIWINLANALKILLIAPSKLPLKAVPIAKFSSILLTCKSVRTQLQQLIYKLVRSVRSPTAHFTIKQDSALLVNPERWWQMSIMCSLAWTFSQVETRIAFYMPMKHIACSVNRDITLLAASKTESYSPFALKILKYACIKQARTLASCAFHYIHSQAQKEFAFQFHQARAFI